MQNNNLPTQLVSDAKKNIQFENKNPADSLDFLHYHFGTTLLAETFFL